MDNPIVVAAELLVILVALALAVAVVAQQIFGKRGYSREEIDQHTAEYHADREPAEAQAEQPEEVVS